MQQQQQHADYDLLAVFPDEPKANTATAKLHKEGFDEDEVYLLAAGTAGSGLFREHGPNRNRNEIFLQTHRVGPHPLLVVILAIVSSLVLGGLTFAASFALPALPEPLTILLGVVVGLILGTIIGLLQRGRVRGAIGQSTRHVPTRPSQGARTMVAMRFHDPDNISRRSRARAILINSEGKIDRSVGRRE